MTIAHQDAERAREHIGEHIRKREGLQAQSAIGTPERSQLAEGVDTGSKETRSGQQRDSTCPRTPSGTKVDLVDSTSESDTSDPGGMPQFFRGSPALGACPPKLQHTLPRRQDGEEVRSEVAAQEAEELPAADTRRKNPGLGLPQVAGTNSSSKETGNGDAKAPAPDQPPGGSDEFARDVEDTCAGVAIRHSTAVEHGHTGHPDGCGNVDFRGEHRGRCDRGVVEVCCCGCWNASGVETPWRNSADLDDRAALLN